MAVSWSIRPRPSSILSSGSPSITTPELDLSGSILYSGTNPNNATVTKYQPAEHPRSAGEHRRPQLQRHDRPEQLDDLPLGRDNRTLNPGVYTGGITLSGSSSVTLNPGIYYINGGGISMSGPSSISGNGVLIYNTGGGSINLSGTGNISLNPMTSGTYAGITIFQDRSNTASATMSGGSNINNTGTFYFPGSSLTLSGTSGIAAMGAQVIAKNLTFSGSAASRSITTTRSRARPVSLSSNEMTPTQPRFDPGSPMPASSDALRWLPAATHGRDSRRGHASDGPG